MFGKDPGHDGPDVIGDARTAFGPDGTIFEMIDDAGVALRLIGCEE
jgi:hypothetical protein